MRLYKYMKIEHNKDYVANIILNKPQSLKLSNIFEFNDALEGSINFHGAGYTNTENLPCNECKLYDKGKCTALRNCLDCIDNYTCNKNKYIKTNHCTKYSNCLDNIPFRRRGCLGSVVSNEIFNKRILCMSKSPHSYALIEKFCGKYGVIFEYDVPETLNILEVEYTERPIVHFSDKVDIALDICKNGFNRPMSNSIIKWKHIDFEYEHEVRIVVYKESTELYTLENEDSLGIKLVGVTFIHDDNLVGLDDELINDINNVGLAACNRGIKFNCDTITDFKNGNNINGNHLNKYIDDNRDVLKNLGEFISGRLYTT